MVRFDAKALYAALDRQRSARGMTWKQVATEIGVAATTITRTKIGGRLEVDGMLAMVRWLGETVETFTTGPAARAGRAPKSKRSVGGNSLAGADVVAFIPTTNPARSRKFFEATLGLRFISEDPFAIVFDANGTTIRVANVASIKGFRPAPFTIIGWGVADIESTLTDLAKRGVQFERYDGMQQDDRGIWTSPSGARIAWFKDPEGNVLSLTQY